MVTMHPGERRRAREAGGRHKAQHYNARTARSANTKILTGVRPWVPLVYPTGLTPSPLGKRVLGVGWGAYSRGMEVAGPFRGSFIAFKPLSLGLTAATLPPPAEAARDDAPRQGC